MVHTTVMNNKSARGLAVIINNTYDNESARAAKYGTLAFTDKDGNAMKDALDFLGFATLPLKNASEDQISGVIDAFASYTDYPAGYDCFAIVFSGHGNKNSVIVAEDGKEFNFEEAIVQRFNKDVSDQDVSDHIASVPIIIFIDACRGTLAPKAKAQEILFPDNMMVAYATREGNVSFGTEHEGSFWMQTLAKELKTSKKSVSDIVAEVNAKLISDDGIKQKPIVWNTTVSIVLSEHGELAK